MTSAMAELHTALCGVLADGKRLRIMWFLVANPEFLAGARLIREGLVEEWSWLGGPG